MRTVSVQQIAIHDLHFSINICAAPNRFQSLQRFVERIHLCLYTHSTILAQWESQVLFLKTNGGSGASDNIIHRLACFTRITGLRTIQTLKLVHHCFNRSAQVSWANTLSRRNVRTQEIGSEAAGFNEQASNTKGFELPRETLSDG